MAPGDPRLDYKHRLIDRLLDDLLTQLPALWLAGPRATGKTTTIGRRAATVVRLDREAEAAAFAADPDAALAGLEEPVLLDEWQEVPGVFGAVRRAVEADPRPGRFFLTGSVRAELEQKTWPGTGRLIRLQMYPMTIREQLGRTGGQTFFERLAEARELAAPAEVPDLRGYLELALRSGFPTPSLHLSGHPRQAWLESYLDQLLTHDVEQLEEPVTKRRDPHRLRNYFEAYALNSAGVADHKTLYDAAGVTKATGSSYEKLLTDLLIVEQLPAWTSNRLKRLGRRPKRYVVDPALLAAALRVDEPGVMRDGDLLGRILDTFVASQLRPELAICATRPRIHHLRTEHGRQEIDLLAELGGQHVIGIEVKASASPDRAAARHLVWLREQLGERFAAGVLLHTGPRVFELAEGIVAAPIAALWAE
ncbi:MAG: ATP-binding protein [Thermoleophilia bacterium]|nr:ATP-binding protein [Thermoleophilia bacterium]